MTDMEKSLARLLRQAMQDMELLADRLRCDPTGVGEQFDTDDCLTCPVKTDCECIGTPHWVHAREAEALIRRVEHAAARADVRRPCFVDGRRARFHRWCDRSEIVAPSCMTGGHNGGEQRCVLGLVEYEDGTCAEVYPSRIVFLSK